MGFQRHVVGENSVQITKIGQIAPIQYDAEYLDRLITNKDC